MKKLITLAVGFLFFTTAVSFAASVDPAKIVVPRDSGRIVEAYQGAQPNAPLIVYLQDIHMNYEARKAEGIVLESLIRDYGFDLVFAEGYMGGSVAAFKSLRADNSLDVRKTAAEELLRKGIISAVNYVDLSTDYNFTVYGVEDLGLYKKETEDQVAIFDSREAMTKLIAAMQNIASNLKLHIYTKEMRDLDDKVAAYGKDEIGLVEYVKTVEGLAAANSIDIKTFPSVALFIDSANIEGQIDFAAVETERTAATDAIEKALKDKAKDDFLAKGVQFRTGDLPQGEFYAYLKNAAQTAGIDLSAHKNLALYTQYIVTYEKIDTTQLFKELDQLVDTIREALTKTPEQKQLSRIDKGLAILSGFANTKLVPDEYNYLQQNKAEFNLKGWLEFLNAQSIKFGLTNPVPTDVASIEATMPVLERFYAASFDRDNAFIANIKTAMTKLNKDKAVFVGGGFHTPNMKRLLRENGFAYLVIAPRVDFVKNYDDIYKERVKIDLDYLNKISATVPTASQPPANNKAELGIKEGTPGWDNVNAALKAAGVPVPTAALQRPDVKAILGRVIGGTLTSEVAGAQIRDLLQPPAGPGAMGNYDFTSGTIDAANNVLKVAGAHRVTGAAMSADIPVEEATRADFTAKVEAALGTLPQPVHDVVAPRVMSALAQFKGKFYRLMNNRPGVFGTEIPGAITVSESLFDDFNIASGHEALHLLLRVLAQENRATGIAETEARQAARQFLLGQLPQGINTVADGSGMTCAQYRDMYPSEDAQDHYAIRAFIHQFNTQEDNAVSERISGVAEIFSGTNITTTNIFNAGTAAAADAKQKPRKYCVLVPRLAKDDASVQLDVAAAVRDLKGEVRFVQVVTTSDAENAVRTAAPDEIVVAALPRQVVSDIQQGKVAPDVAGKLANVPFLPVENIRANAQGEKAANLLVATLLNMAEVRVASESDRAVLLAAIDRGVNALATQPIALEDVRGLIPFYNSDVTKRAGIAAKIVGLLGGATPADWGQKDEDLRSYIRAAIKA